MKRFIPLLCFLGCTTTTVQPITPVIPPVDQCAAHVAHGASGDIARVCGDLFAEPTCREAWRGGAPDTLVEACARAYCPSLPALAACADPPDQSLAATAELFDAALRRDDPKYTGRLGRVLATLATPVVIEAADVELPPSGPGNVQELTATVALGGEQLVLITPLHPDGLVLPWSTGSESIRRGSLERLREELVRVRTAHPAANNLVLSASDDVEYGDVIAVMDAVRTDADGERLFDRVAFAVSPRE